MRNAAESESRSAAVAAAAWWNWGTRTADIWWTRQRGIAAVRSAQRRRFGQLVAFANANSPFYRERYRGLRLDGVDVGDVPVVGKAELVPRFDDWVTDRQVTRSDVEHFLADPARVGTWYRDRYLVWTSSGSTGVPGIYLQDADALATYDALLAAQLGAPTVALSLAWNLAASGGCAALVTATGGHYASVASWRRLTAASPLLRMRTFSILQPLPQLVEALNTCRPAFLASYPTMLALLAEEKAAGRLRIAPARLWSGGECLTPTARDAIERVFGCRVVNEYGASECLSMAIGCDGGWLHVNADWVVLEAVDAQLRPTPPGQPSHTVLLTNLANRVQPLIRYDLGDSIVVKPEPCHCGNPLPAIRVEGRRDDMVALADPDGAIVRLLPLALATVIEESGGIHRFQVVQEGAGRLRVRVDLADAAARRQVWPRIAAALSGYLATQGLPNVAVALDRRPPEVDARSGKIKQVIGLPPRREDEEAPSPDPEPTPSAPTFTPRQERKRAARNRAAPAGHPRH